MRRKHYAPTKAARTACSDNAKHTKSPEGYLEWHAWAENMAKAHKQVKCPTCGFYAIWVPKEKRK